MRRIRFFVCKRLIDNKILREITELLKAKVYRIRYYPSGVKGVREEHLYLLEQNGFQFIPFQPTLQEYIDATHTIL